MTSRQNPHYSEEYLWPSGVSPVLPNIGDSVEFASLGSRTVTGRSYVYDNRNAGRRSAVEHVIIDISCE